MSFAFNETYYLKSKLAQLQADDAATYGSWTTTQVKQAIEDAGMTVEGHYQQYSMVEGTSANPYFNTTEYLEAKLAQLKSIDPAQYNNWTVDDVVKAFQDAGLTAEEHYQMYGCKETDANGYLINPSNAFDANAYVQAKLAQLVAADPETYGEWTTEDVVEAIADAGMTPVEHFEDYGKAEGQAAGIAMVQTVPVTQRVANDELRDATGENVPSNYNKPVDAPKDVTAAEAAENGGVDKPCDMADSSTVKPEEPVATPADSDYVAVPGGGIADTNENPVELVKAEVKDTEGNTVATASEYGVASTTTDANGNTVKTVQPVDENGAVDAEADPIQTVTTSADGKTQTTETKVTDAQGNSVEVAEKVTTADDGSTVTDTVATATDADGNQTAKTETRVAADADGEVTGTNTSYTDESGKTSTDTTGEDPGTPEDPTPEPEPEPTPADSGSGATATTFTMEYANNTLTVGGTATGDLTLNLATLSAVSGTREGLTATADASAPTYADTVISGTGNVEVTGGVLQISAEHANNHELSGTGGATITASAGAQTLTVQTAGTNGITAGTGKDVITLGEQTGTDTLTVEAGTKPTAQTADVTLSGDWDDGDSVTVSGIGTSVTYTKLAEDNGINAVAEKLKDAINDDDAATVTATVNGAVVTLTAKVAGVAFDAAATATNGGKDVPAQAQVDTVTLTAGFAAGDKVTIKGVADDDVEYTVTAEDVAGEPLKAIITGILGEFAKATNPTVDAAAGNSEGTLTLTAKEAGKGFDAKVSATSTGGNAEGATTTPNVEGKKATDTQKADVTAGTANGEAVESDSTPTAYDVVTNFDTAHDKLILKDSNDSAVTQAMTATDTQVTTVSNGVVTFATEITELADKIEAVFTAMGTDEHVAVFEHTENETTNTYVLLGDGAAGQSAADVVVELVGVTDVANVADILAS